LEKKCTICGEWFSCTTEYFYKNDKNKSDGLAPNCIECEKRKTLKYIEEHKEQHYKRMKQYQRENKQKVKGIISEWKDNHREEINAYSMRYRKSEYGKEKFRQYGQHRKHDVYDQEWNSCKKFFNYKCACCGLPLDKHYLIRNGKLKLFDFHKDHVYYDGKNDLSNCIPLCNDCNNKKKRKSFNEFYSLSNPNYTYERYFKIYLWIRYEYKKHILPKRRYKGQHLEQRLKEIELSIIQNKSS
jgi:hypothetical protein